MNLPVLGIREIAIAALVALVLGAAGGWMVNGWRLGKDVERLKAEVSAQEGANKRCSVGVADVQDAWKKLAAAQAKRDAEIKVAVAKAAADAQEHTKAAQETLSRAAPLPGAECSTAAQEARAYVDRRRAR